MEEDISSLTENIKDGYFTMKKLGMSKSELRKFASKSVRGLYSGLFDNEIWAGKEKYALLTVLKNIDDEIIRNIYLREAYKILGETKNSNLGKIIDASMQGIFAGLLLPLIAYFYWLINWDNMDTITFRCWGVGITFSQLLWYLFLVYDINDYLFN